MASGIPTYEQFRRSLAGTPMVGEARGIYNAALRGGINPAFVSGLASSESSYGREGYAVGSYNPYGLGVHLGWKFKNYTQATEKLTKTLSGLGYPKLYRQSGIAGVIGQYTPYGDANNDPKAHARNIISAGRRAGGNAALVYTGKGAPPPVDEPPQRGATPPGVQPPAPSGRQSGNEIGAMLLRQYRSSQMGTLTPDEARANTIALARAFGSAASQPTSTTPAMGGGATGGGAAGGAAGGPVVTASTNYGSMKGIARPLPTPLGGGDYGYSDPEGQDGRHLADDWFAPGNTPLASPVSGTVFRVKPDKAVGQKASGQIFGGSVYIKDQSGRIFVFRHVENPQKYTQAGQRIRAGQRIGAVKPWSGSSHAHIELYSPGPYSYSSARAMDPNAFFRQAGLK